MAIVAVVVFFILLGLAALFLQTEWGRGVVEGIAVAEIRALLTDEAALEVGRIEGNFLTGARLLDAKILFEGETVVEIDTLQLRYNLLTLFRRTFSASDVYVGGLRLWAREDAEGEWNVAKIFRPVEPDPEAAPWIVDLRSITLRDGLTQLHFHHPERDSVLIVDELNLQVEDFLSDADGVRARAETVLATVYPAVVDPVSVDLSMTGDFTGTSAVIERLLLRSERSDITLVGRLDWEDSFAWDADLMAEPFALADLRQFINLPLYGTAHTRIHSAGDVDEFAATVRANFIDGGVLDLTGVIATARVGEARYAVEGRVDDFDPGRFLGNPALAGNLTGTLDIDLAGPRPELFHGPVDIRLRGSRFGEQQINHADLVGAFERGRINFTLDARVPGADLTARGAARPFDEEIVYDVRGDVRNLNLATLLRDPEQALTARQARFRLDGRGLDPATLVTAYTVNAEGVSFGELNFVSGRAQGRLSRGQLTFDAGVVLPDGGGALTGVGTARPFAEPLVFAIDRGSFTDINLAVITGDPDQISDLTGSFSAAGTGTSPETMRLDFSVSLGPSAYAHLTIASAQASGTLAGGELALDLAADLAEAGSLTAVGTMQPFAEPITYSFSGRVDNLDLAVLMQDPAQSSQFTGTYTLVGSGLDAETMAANFTLQLEPSRYRGQELIAGTVEGTLEGGVLVADIDAQTPEGRIAFVITLQPFIDEPQIGIAEARFAALDLAALLGEPLFVTDLHGQIELDLVGFDITTATGTGRIILDRSRINAAILEGGVIEFTLDQGRITAVAALDFEQGEAAFAFQGRPFDEPPTYTVDGRLDAVDLVALLGDQRGRSDVTLEFDLTGVGYEPETMEARLVLDMIDSRLPDALVERLAADVAMTEGVLVVDTFSLKSDFADAQASGQVALYNPEATTGLHLSATVRDAGPLDAFTPAQLTVETGTIEGLFAGVPGEPIAFDGTVVARQFTYGAYGASWLDARVNVQYLAGEMIPVEGRGRIRFDYLSLPTFNLREGDVSIDFFDDELAAYGSIVVDEDRDLVFRTTIELIDDPMGPYHTMVLIEELNLRVDEEHWELLQPSSVSIGDERYLIRNFLLFSDGQQIVADGEIDLQGDQTLLVTIEDLVVDPFVDLIGYQDVGGVLSAILSLEGTAAAPVVEASVEIENITSNGDLVGALDATFAFTDERLNILAVLTHVEGETLRTEGFLPMSFRLDGVPAEPAPDAPASLVLTSEAFPIAWAEPFIPPRMVTNLDGVLTTEVTVGGTYSDPMLDGIARVDDGLIQLEVTGEAVFENIVLALEFAGNEARIAEARVHDGRGGLLRIEGNIVLPDLSVGDMDLLLLATNFRAIETETYSGLTINATRSHNLRFRGTIADPILTGNVTLLSGDIFLTQELIGPEFDAVELTEAQIQRIEATFGVRVADVDLERSAFVDNLDLNLTVVVERNVWMRSRTDPRFDIEFFGEVAVEKPPDAEYQMFGSIEVIRGRIELPTLVRRRFEIGTVDGTYGTLVFNGPLMETMIDLRAGLDAPSGTGAGIAATVFVEFHGRLAEEPELTLASDPPMEQSDIACVIATGRPCGEAFNPDIAEDIAIAQLGLLVENIAARQLGLDVVEIRRRPTGELVFTFGAYVADRVFAAVSQPVTEARSASEQTGWLPEVLIEYEVLRWLLLRLEHRNIGGAGGSVFIQFDY